MAKKSDKPKRKKITFKFVSKESGRVLFEGLHFDEESGEGEELPKPVVKVLEAYGFDSDTQEDWFDILSPMTSLEESLEFLSAAVTLRILSHPKKTKRGKRKAVFFAELDKCGLIEGRDVYDALDKAFSAWNKRGRPIGGVKLEAAMKRVLLEVNKKRG
jgi:hypothetical protein